MTKSLDDIGQLVGLAPGEALAIWEQEKANKAKLDRCALHQFRLTEHVDANPITRGRLRFTCLHCGGTLQYTNILWYERGAKAVDANARVVIDRDGAA
jgi:hypothetical protein